MFFSCLLHLLSVLNPTGSLLSVAAGEFVSDLRNPDRTNLHHHRTKQSAFRFMTFDLQTRINNLSSFNYPQIRRSCWVTFHIRSVFVSLIRTAAVEHVF